MHQIIRQIYLTEGARYLIKYSYACDIGTSQNQNSVSLHKINDCADFLLCKFVKLQTNNNATKS